MSQLLVISLPEIAAAIVCKSSKNKQQDQQYNYEGQPESSASIITAWIRRGNGITAITIRHNLYLPSPFITKICNLWTSD